MAGFFAAGGGFTGVGVPVVVGGVAGLVPVVAGGFWPVAGAG